MTSLLNSVYMGSDTSFTGLWEDVQLYNSVAITLRSAVDGSATLMWANSKRGFPASDLDVIATERLFYTASEAQTTEFNHRARWYKIRFDHNLTPDFTDVSFNLQSLHRDTAVQLCIADDDMTQVNVKGNAFMVNLSDRKGNINSSFFTTLSDANGLALAQTERRGPRALFVALVDACNNPLKTTNDETYVCTTNSQGHTQASTINVSGASGSALYITGSDVKSWSTTYTKGEDKNSVYVSLLDSSGKDVGTGSNPIYMKSKFTSGGVRHFDISQGITENMQQLTKRSTTLYNFFTYNDGPVTLWTKVYDFSPSDLNDVPLFTVLPGISNGTITIAIAINNNTGGSTTTILAQYIPLTSTTFRSVSDLNSINNDFTFSLNNELFLTLTNNSTSAIKFGSNFGFWTNLGFSINGSTTLSIGESIVSKSYIPYAPLNDKVRLNIATPSQQCRDMAFPKGMTFNSGIYLRTSQEQQYDDTNKPGANVLFVNGTYI